MAKVALTVEVQEHSYKVTQAVKELIQATKMALDDGFQPGSDLPVIVTSALSQLMSVMGSFPMIAAEADDADKAAFIRSWALGGVDIANVFLKK